MSMLREISCFFAQNIKRRNFEKAVNAYSANDLQNGDILFNQSKWEKILGQSEEIYSKIFQAKKDLEAKKPTLQDKCKKLNKAADHCKGVFFTNTAIEDPMFIPSWRDYIQAAEAEWGQFSNATFTQEVTESSSLEEEETALPSSSDGEDALSSDLSYKEEKADSPKNLGLIQKSSAPHAYLTADLRPLSNDRSHASPSFTPLFMNNQDFGSIFGVKAFKFELVKELPELTKAIEFARRVTDNTPSSAVASAASSAMISSSFNAEATVKTATYNLLECLAVLMQKLMQLDNNAFSKQLAAKVRNILYHSKWEKLNSPESHLNFFVAVSNQMLDYLTTASSHNKELSWEKLPNRMANVKEMLGYDAEENIKAKSLEQAIKTLSFERQAVESHQAEELQPYKLNAIKFLLAREVAFKNEMRDGYPKEYKVVFPNDEQAASERVIGNELRHRCANSDSSSSASSSSSLVYTTPKLRADAG